MPSLVVETVQLERHGLPVIVILAAKAFQPDYCAAEVFIVSASSGSDIPFGSQLRVGRDQVDEDLAIAVAREVGRTELFRRLQDLPADERTRSVDFVPVDPVQIRALRCMGKYPQLAGVSARSQHCDSEIRAFVQSVRGVYLELGLL